jgi:hypothetical protein
MDKNHILQYTEYREDGIFGCFQFAQDEHPFMVTLSHAYEQASGKFAPIVLPGVYKCVRGIHSLTNGVPFETFEITGITGHSGLLFHAGNFNKDSHGCTLCGVDTATMPDGHWMITHSRGVFASWMAHLGDVQEFMLEVKG